MRPVTIKPVKTPEEVQETACLASEIWHEWFPAILSAEQIDYMVERFQSEEAISEQLEKGYRYFQLWNSDGGLMGYTCILPEEDRLFLSKLYVHKNYRKQGLARLTLDFLEGISKEMGLDTVYLTVNRHNAGAVACYQALGFQTVREQVSDIGGGFVMDDYVMEKRLPKRKGRRL